MRHVANERIDLLRRESREYFERLDVGMHEYFERLDAEMREFRVESREINRMMVAALEQQSGILRELRDSIVEMRADIVAQRQGFLALIDELRRHGLGGAPA